VTAFGQLVTVAVNTAQNHTNCPISISPEALLIFEKLNDEADRRINDTAIDTEIELWNRADLKAMKLGGLIAVGLNPHEPNVTASVAEWAVATVRREIGDMMSRFKSGDVGAGEAKQEIEIRRLFDHFQDLSPKQKRTMRCPHELFDNQVVPANFLTVYSRRLACFRNDRRGASRALADCLADMVRREVLEMVPLQQLQTQFKMKSAIYYPGPAW
jgi:hypothetical protein